VRRSARLEDCRVHKIAEKGSLLRAYRDMRGQMKTAEQFEIFLVCAPGLEEVLCAEARDRRFRDAKAVPGGVQCRGGWREVWRANLQLRGVARVLVRLGAFRALHLAQLDKRARQFPWGKYLRPDVPVRVEASCAKSRIYHSGAAAARIETAIREGLGAPISDEASLIIKVRIFDDLCTISVDTSGESLHKRGHKEAVGKAPLRETMASLFLRACGYDGREPVVDPMCGSGTFVIEAAEIAAGLNPGRSREFPFEQLAGFDAARWHELRASGAQTEPTLRYYGSDRDAGAIRMSRSNAERAGVARWTVFEQCAISDVLAPIGPPGLVMVNPPYGTRIGEKKPLFALYGALGHTLLSRFSGWRVGLITTDAALARTTKLPFGPVGKPVAHGGLKVCLYQTKPLP
jgi:putative N6-adenine-specific DNA methylase